VEVILKALQSSAGDSLTILVLASVAGIIVAIVFIGLVVPPSGKPRRSVQLVSAGRLQSLSVRLNQQQLEISSSQYLTKSLTLGIPLAIGLYVLVGSVLLAPVGILVGFVITQSKLEQLRDRKQIEYSKALASTCDIIRTAYNVNPSLKKALDAVAEYGTSPVKEDFQEILVATSQERFLEGLQSVADRRRSIVFDTIASSLIRAYEASGEVNEMLVRLADSTRRNVGAFEEAMTSQINARSNIQWGVFGPWLIFGMFRLITLALGMTMGSNNLFEPMNSFFSTPVGNLVVFGAALLSMRLYRSSMGVAQRGLVVNRISTDDTSVQVGQRPLAGQSMISSQSYPSELA
jgi:Flp pilus assembly protein TadB